MLREEVAERLQHSIREICAGRGWAIEVLAVEIDHVHLFVSCPPRDAPAQVMNVVKSMTARERRTNSLACDGRTGAGSCGPTASMFDRLVVIFL